MKSRFGGLTLLLASLALPIVAPTSARADDGASALTKEGLDLGKEGKWPEARAKLSDAYDQAPTWENAANLAVAERHLADWANAARHLEFAVKHFPDGGPREQRDKLTGDFAEARSKVGAVRVQVNVTACSVTVNGIEVGASPIESDVYVTPGRQTFRFVKQGYETEVKVIDVEPGQAAAVEVELKVKIGGGGGGGGEGPGPVTPAAPRPKWPAFVGYGLAAGGLGAGIGTLVAANGKGSAIQGAAAACKVGPSAACKAGQSAQDSQNTLSNASVWSFIAAGVLAGASTGYLIWSLGGPDGRPTKTLGRGKAGAATLQVLPVVGPSVQGASLDIRF